MALTTMYPGKVNSPETTVASPGIDEDDTTIPVMDTAVFPAGPNEATLNPDEEDAETVLYTDRSTTSGPGNLTGVTRGFQGTAKAWAEGTNVARVLTEYDYDALCDNITGHDHTSGNGTAIPEGGLSLSDVTTGDASTSKHGLLLKATAPAANVLNVVGIANGETAYANKALFDATNPEALGTVGPGTATVAARRDHVHTMPTLDGVAAPSDVTTLDVSASAHGLCPKFPNNSTTFFRGDGTYAAPPKGGVLTWSEVTGTTQALAVNTGYILNHATTMIVATLPSTAAVGDVIRVVGKGAGMWKVAQNASQYIRFAGLTTTTGTGGYLQAENAYDCIELICTTANVAFTVISSIGNIVVV